ncbi:helix-turn-helix transcriptional regulator [Rhodobacter maris]|uniref:LuxR family transcriptional regulator n=1 Tax=Rhodobacter maris TaxID=446682 RepID=A0A285SUI2_9RHOB|nr:LuxR family transcriptional regulator [Rhodobacter maris]SOC11881.1 LuxR family transcriptional regulator [Rhodobacter maris]
MLEHLETVFLAEDIGTIWSLHCARMAKFGFDRLLYGFTRFLAPQLEGSIDDTLILSNHAPEYLDVFLGERLFVEAPMVRWAADSVGAQSWSRVQEYYARKAVTPGLQRVFDLNRRFGIVAGYSISFSDPSTRAKGAIGLCARAGLSQEDVEEIWAEHGRTIWVLNTAMHLKISSLPFPTTRRALTPRQREVLEWVGDGKTIADIAQIMGLTCATVEKHLRLAREVLEVETTAQAVLKATLQKQLFLTAL